MAKKLNKKVAIIGIVLLLMIIGAGVGLLVARSIKRNPDRALAKAQQALEVGDYETAEQEFRKSVGYAKTDQYKIERLFDLAEFALIQNDQHDADWTLARGCWNEVTKLDIKNLPARRQLLDFFLQTAEAGDNRLWKTIHEYTSEIIEVLDKQGTEPDLKLSTTHAKAILSMAQRGDTPNRKELLTKSIALLEQLLDKNATDESLYQLRAEAALLQGNLNELAGIRNATETANTEALNWLEAGIEQADDKAAATAILWTYKLQTSPADPNTINQLRAGIEAAAKTAGTNEAFNILISRAYSERQGNTSPLADTNRAIEAIRQAREMDLENVEYILRMATLLYRKGSAFDDPDSIADAITVAEEALTLPGTQDTPGPLNGRNQSYRYLINTFLANTYLEKAYAAMDEENDVQVKEWTEKARPRVKEINDYLKTADNPVVQKFKGMLALADGNTDNAIRQMYSAYEQLKALDTEGQPSNIDPTLCITLSEVMKDQNESGMQLEFLQKAIYNQAGIVFQKPQLWLDYADVFAQLRDWNSVLAIVNNRYQPAYGTNERSNLLKMNGLIATRQFEQALTMIDARDADDPETLQLRLALLNNQISQQRRDMEQLEKDGQTPSNEQTQELASLRAQQIEVLSRLLKKDADKVNVQTLISIYNHLINNDGVQTATAILDQYLVAKPDDTTAKTLLLQAQEPSPNEVTTERFRELQLQALESMTDTKDKSLSLAQYYRSAGEYDKAMEQITQIPQADEKDPAVLTAKFEITLAQEDIQAAEGMKTVLRAENVDRCDGSMFAAQIEMAKKNYDGALRELDNCLTIQPLSSQLYFLKSRVYTQQEDYEPAIENLQQAVRMNPLNPVYARSMASVLFARNTKLGSKVTPQQKAQALGAIQRARALNPTDMQLQSVFAENIAASNPDQALLIRQQLLQNQPTVTNALMLGNMALRMARATFDNAKRDGLIALAGTSYQKAIEIAPENKAAQQAYVDYRTMMGEEDPTGIIGDDKNMLWQYYLRHSQFDQAMEILNELIAATPDDPMVLRGMVLCNEGMGNRDQIKIYLDQLAAQTDEKDTELWVLQKYLDNGYTNEAEKKLASFEERYPDENVIQLIRAWIEMGNGNLDQALSLTNQYIESDTENAGAWRLRGRLHRLMSQPQKAISDLQRSKSILPDPMVRLELATVYQEVANIPGAIGELKEGLKDPQSPLQLRLMLERIYRNSGNTREIEQFYQSTLEKYPSAFYWYYRVGDYYLQQNNPAKANAFLKQAWDLSVQQNNVDIGIFMAYLDGLLKDAQYDEALAFSAEWIDTPLASIAYAYTAQVQFKQNNTAAATESFNVALDKAGINDRMQSIVMEKMLATVGAQAVTAWSQAQLAKDAEAIPPRLLAYRLAVKNERFNEAIEQTTQCIEIVGPDHPGWLSLAMKKGNAMIMAYTKTADKEYLARSIELFETILAKQPNNPSLLNNLAYLLADNDTQLDTALKYARKAHQGNPGNTIFLDTYAYVQCKLKNYEQAERNLLRAVQILDISRQPIPWDMYKHLGMARQGLGNNSQAVQDYQKALEASDDIPAKEKQAIQQTIDELKLLL
ncbi:MAG: tetratricopeptide repeat protein [Planctomycetota bacterium]|jgi:predicted Zn-dependent protease